MLTQHRVLGYWPTLCDTDTTPCHTDMTRSSVPRYLLYIQDICINTNRHSWRYVPHSNTCSQWLVVVYSSEWNTKGRVGGRTHTGPILLRGKSAPVLSPSLPAWAALELTAQRPFSLPLITSLNIKEDMPNTWWKADLPELSPWQVKSWINFGHLELAKSKLRNSQSASYQ